MVEFDTRTQERPSADLEEEATQPSTAQTSRDLEGIVVTADADNSIRWSVGERLHHLFERRCDHFEQLGAANHLAISSDEATLTYGELDRRANCLARYLIKRGLGSGDIVGLLFDRSFHSYVSLLAVLKINAAYVPLDVGFPLDRIGYIANDAGIGTILTLSTCGVQLRDLAIPLISLDLVEEEIDAESDRCLDAEEVGPPVSELCYIIYTSGSTGRPKGVPIEHASICNFVRVAAEVYGYTSHDRVYQGLTIAFDFSVEEIWVPLIAGATLVPNQTGGSLVGTDLWAFLADAQVTALCCVPTLLATMEEDLPDLRLLIVSGEACPQDLVKRWHRPGRTILNAYGPTEVTVTATVAELRPEEPVTIGAPLPTYSIVILAPDKDRALPKGQIGEIGIASVGLSKGYLGRDDLTQAAFIPDFLNLPNNPSRRIYLTGDLGCITEPGQIEYLGRIDTQVKIRGYRIELTEIESVIMQLPEVAQAVVDTYEPEPGAVELVAYYTLIDGVQGLEPADVARELRTLLPSYMVPAFYECLSTIPMLPSDKADRKSLPAPKGPRCVATDKDFVAPETDLEKAVAGTLANILAVERVSIDDHFFQDLGAHSLLMARFCAAIRDQLSLWAVSIRDIYLNPNVRSLAAFLSEKPQTEATSSNQEYRIPGNREYYICGALQLLFYASNIALGLWVFVFGLNWVFSATDMWGAYARTFGLGLGLLTLSIVLPFTMKWALIGRWKQEKFPIWSLSYFRFWMVKQYIRVNPMALFVGTPIYNLYLRMLGAKIGRNVVIYSKSGPVCTDLISIGDNTILSRETLIKGYRAEGGYIETGPISIGRNAFVGEASVVEINAAMEDDTQLGHASALQTNQIVAAGKRYHGSPAQETTTNYCTVEPKNCSRFRRLIYSAYLVISTYFIVFPLPIFAMFHFLPFLFGGDDALSNISTLLGDHWQKITTYLPIVSFGLFVVSIPLGLVFVAALPRIANLFIKEGKVYVLYGIHYILFKYIRGVSNSKFYNVMFGDSSYIVYYLKLIGYDLSKVEQTGSNFGTVQQHDNPLLCHIGTGTMVSDALRIMNAEMSTSSFKVSKTTIGDKNYLGNSINYPSNSKTGHNCLLATKVMIPIDGPVRENVGLLGSPCFEIPRATLRDQEMADMEQSLRDRELHNKNVHNIWTMAYWLLALWLFSCVGMYLGFASITLYNTFGITSLVVGFLVGFALTIGYFVGLEWLSLGFKRLRPGIFSVYDRRYWGVERHWKVADSPLIYLFAGTPFRSMIYRLLGVRMGKKVFDDGCMMSERTMIQIGDYCTLNEESTIQCHSLEEGVFKCDAIKLGRGCTLGFNAFAHYGVTMGDNVILEADSFLMKGEVVEANARWQGNPAKAI